MTALLPALAGVNLIYGMGMLELGVTFSYAQLLIDNEIAEMVKRVVRGVEVNDETLAVDLIKRVGGGSGKHYLLEKHTMAHVKQEQSRANLFDRKCAKSGKGRPGAKMLESVPLKRPEKFSTNTNPNLWIKKYNNNSEISSKR